MGLAAAEIMFSLPTSVAVLALNFKIGLRPWVSWEDTHSDFNRFDTYPFPYFQYFPAQLILINLNRYSIPVCSFIFFIFLGMSGEAGGFYRRKFWRVAGLVGLKPKNKPYPSASWCVGLTALTFCLLILVLAGSEAVQVAPLNRKARGSPRVAQ